MTARRVIAAIDNGPANRSVISVAKGMAGLFAAALEVVHVTEDRGATAAAKAAEHAGVELRRVSGHPADVIAALAREDGVEALVLGLRRIVGTERPVGHVTRELITSVVVPFVLVPPGMAGTYALRRVLVPLEGTVETSVALRGVMEFACRGGFDVVALHVHTPQTVPPFADAPQHETSAWVDEFVARHCPPGDIRLEVRYGVPARQTLLALRELDVDLIALSWGGSLGEGRALTVREAIERSPVPVLLMPAPAREPVR